MHGWRSDQRFAWERKKGSISIERQACFFLLHHPSWVQGRGWLFMIHCWYTMSMIFSNGWRGTESTLLPHLFCKTGGMNGREWVKVTGGFPRRILVLIIWERAVALFFVFLKNPFCTYVRLKRTIRPPRLISPLVLKAQTLNLYYYYSKHLSFCNVMKLFLANKIYSKKQSNQKAF